MFKQFNGNLRYHRSYVTRFVFILIFVLLGFNVCCDQKQNDNTSIKVYDDMNEALEDLFELYSEYVNNPIEGSGNIVYFYNHYGNQEQKRINTIAAKMRKQNLPRISIDINKKDKYEPLRFANDNVYYQENVLDNIVNVVGINANINAFNFNGVFDVIDFINNRRRFHVFDGRNKEYYIHTEEAIASLLHMHFQQQNNQQIQRQDNNAQRIVVFVSKGTMCPRCQRILQLISDEYRVKFLVICFGRDDDGEKNMLDNRSFTNYTIQLDRKPLFPTIKYIKNESEKRFTSYYVCEHGLESIKVERDLRLNIVFEHLDDDRFAVILRKTSHAELKVNYISPLILQTNADIDDINNHVRDIFNEQGGQQTKQQFLQNCSCLR